MRAIFLDIDGVIATPTSVRISYLLGRAPERQFYDGLALAYLGRLVAETGAVVVLSSNWRSGTEGSAWERAVMDNLFAQLAAAGAPVHDSTPRLDSCDRSEEVGAWLDAHPCEGWAIFDDLAPFDARPDVARGHLVRIEDSEGLRLPHYLQALAILQGPLAERVE